MKRNIYKLVSSAKQGLFGLALVVSGTAHSQASYTFAYTGTVQTLTLPAGNWGIKCWGASGGSITTVGTGGVGGFAAGQVAITTNGTQLNIFVGGRGGLAYGTSASAGAGGWNGGGGGAAVGRSGGGGGGASDIRIGGIGAANRIIVAGGGGGDAFYGSTLLSSSVAIGGNGGAPIGQTGDYIASSGAITPGGGGAGANGATPGTAAVASASGTPTGGGGGGSSAAASFGGQGVGGGAGGAAGISGSGSTGSAGGGGGGYAGGAGGVQTVNAGVAGGGGSGYIGGVTSGTNVLFGQVGYLPNPDLSGNGRIIVTELCSIAIYASGSNSTNPAICAGQSVTLTTNAIGNYTWSNGQNTSSIVVAPGTSTMLSLTATGSLNCLISASLSIIVNSVQPVLAITNPSTSICLGATTSLTASGALTYTWTNPGVVNGQTFTPASTAVYTVMGQNGCGTSVSTTTVTVAPLAVSVLATPALVCQGYPATLTSTAVATTFTWQPGALTGSVTSVAPIVNTIYTVTASDGICSGTQTLLVTTKTTPTIVPSTTFVTLCLGDAVTLSASGAGINGTYSWTPGNGTTPSINVSPSTSTLYTVYGTNSLNCMSSAQIPISVQQPLPLNVTATTTLVCAGGQIVLTASGSQGYSWTNGPATAGYTLNQTAAQTVYTVTGSNTSNLCTATKTIALAALTPSVVYTSSASACAGNTVSFSASGATTYTWNGFNTGTSGVYVYTPVQTGTIALIAKTTSLSTTCINTLVASVVVNSNPTISIASTKTTTICKGVTIVLTASGATNYTWTGNVTTNTNSVKPNSTTTYTVLGVDANNCQGTSQYIVTVNPCNSLSEQELSSGITVFPNPNGGEFSIRSNSALSLQLKNAVGQFVRNIELEEAGNFEVNVKDLSNGIYFLSGNSAGNTINVKIVVSK